MSGIITAVRTQKDAYAAAYYYIQVAGTEYAGLEVFKEGHTYSRGDAITIFTPDDTHFDIAMSARSCADHGDTAGTRSSAACM